MMNESCLTCSHIKVCKIYDEARKHNQNSLVNFRSEEMNRVCNNFEIKKIRD